jgi:hypothetical protein
MEPSPERIALIKKAEAFITERIPHQSITRNQVMTIPEMMAAFAIEMQVSSSMNAMQKKLTDFLTGCDKCGKEADNILCDECLAQIQESKPKMEGPILRSFDRKVPLERAIVAATRLINTKWRREPGARSTIPVNADDDDIVLMDFLCQVYQGECG